jgi:hypothetical protein
MAAVRILTRLPALGRAFYADFGRMDYSRRQLFANAAAIAVSRVFECGQ